MASDDLLQSTTKVSSLSLLNRHIPRLHRIDSLEKLSCQSVVASTVTSARSMRTKMLELPGREIIRPRRSHCFSSAGVCAFGQGIVIPREKDVLVVTDIVLGLPDTPSEPGTLVYFLGRLLALVVVTGLYLWINYVDWPVGVAFGKLIVVRKQLVAVPALAGFRDRWNCFRDPNDATDAGRCAG
ncbi:hypothetical protein KCU62_g44, partial [Aureobasidium sp. EXF-3399]